MALPPGACGSAVTRIETSMARGRCKASFEDRALFLEYGFERGRQPSKSRGSICAGPTKMDCHASAPGVLLGACQPRQRCYSMA
jgi:hypothetical protein